MREADAAACGGVMHCFTESWEMAQQALEMGFYISFSGIITFNSAASLREVLQQVPEDRLLIETDSPYLAPVPYRGKPNQPAYVRAVAEKVAELRGWELQQVEQITTRNFNQLFQVS
jgi:TatD DNase family protein